MRTEQTTRNEEKSMKKNEMRAKNMTDRELQNLKDVVFAGLATKWQKAVYRAAWGMGRIAKG